MPMAKDAFAEYQRNRRKAERPCMICGEKGKVTEKHTAAPGAAAIRCCQPCYGRIAGLPPVAPIESQPEDSESIHAIVDQIRTQSRMFDDILERIEVAFTPRDMADISDESLADIISARAFIYSLARKHEDDTDIVYQWAKEKATREVARDQAQAKAKAQIDNDGPFYIRLSKPDNSEIPNIPIRILPPIQIPPPPAG